MTGYREQFNVTAAQTALGFDHKGGVEFISGIGGKSLSITNAPGANPALEINDPGCN